MIRLDVVRDDDVDLGGVDDGGDACDELIAERRFHRVDQRDFFVEDEVGVIA